MGDVGLEIAQTPSPSALDRATKSPAEAEPQGE